MIESTESSHQIYLDKTEPVFCLQYTNIQRQTVIQNELYTELHICGALWF